MTRTLATRLKVLAHPDRLRLIELMRTPEAFPENLVDPAAVGVCVNDLATAAGMPQSTTSRHLTLLAGEGLLEVTTHGQWRYVRPAPEAFEQLGDELRALAGAC